MMKKFKIINFMFLLFACFWVIQAYSQPKIVLKLDDLEARNGTCKFIPVMDYLISKNVKAGLGAIGKRFDNTAITTLTPYLDATNELGHKLFEIWHHGWDHFDPEFKGTSYDYQKKHFVDADLAILNYLGVQMRTFGPPFNASDANTRTVVSENLNYKVFLFTTAVIPGVISISNRVDMENGVGNPDYDFFVSKYEANKSLIFMVLQGHPSMWNGTQMANFKKIVEFLIAKGCEFVTPFEVAHPDNNPDYICNEENTPDTPGNLTGNVTGSSQITLSWDTISLHAGAIKLERKVLGGNFSIIAHLKKDITRFIDKNLADDAVYSYRISAYNCFGSSEASPEIEVFLKKDSAQRIQVESFSASSHLGSYDAGKALDDNLNTYWMVDDELQWLQLNLTNTAYIDRVALSFVNGDSRVYQFSIETSVDGLNWSNSKSFSSNGTSNALEEYKLDENECSYVRFVTGLNSVNNRTWLSGMQLWGFLSTIIPDNSEITGRIKFTQSNIYKTIELRLPEQAEPYTLLKVYNLLGKIVADNRITGNSHLVNYESFMPGIYFMQISNSTHSETLKIILN